MRNREMTLPASWPNVQRSASQMACKTQTGEGGGRGVTQCRAAVSGTAGKKGWSAVPGWSGCAHRRRPPNINRDRGRETQS
eukprot:7255909-Prymnesium_polylepis.1